jgi:hypothetical protein
VFVVQLLLKECRSNFDPLRLASGRGDAAATAVHHRCSKRRWISTCSGMLPAGPSLALRSRSLMALRGGRDARGRRSVEVFTSVVTVWLGWRSG